MSARVDAAAKRLRLKFKDLDLSDAQEQATYMLLDADAHDAANGVHRVTLDKATVERVVDALVMTRMGDFNIEMSEFRNAAWAVLAAAVKEGQ